MSFASSLPPEAMHPVQDPEYLRIKWASGLVQIETYLQKLESWKKEMQYIQMPTRRLWAK